MKAGTGEYGHAWMIEKPDVWQGKDGVANTIVPPTKPTKVTTADLAARYLYMEQMNEYKAYTELVREGRSILIEWYGKAMFLDLHVNKQLPVNLTPRDLLDYLEKTYANPRINRQYMETVRKSFNTSHDSRQPVENYFARLQDARDSATI